ncbi:MAG TPA: GAF domain-containing protein, partial [Conexibacter sp.]|nr:GAF domain-containing protein [Conexibacter sp.]
MTETQALVDALAATLDRPVGVDDRRYRAVAYSSHVDGVDPVRLASILQREAPREVTAWLESLGIETARGVVHVPANARFGMTARVCVPIRFDDALLGYLWLIDEPEPLTAAELEESERCAQELGIALYRQSRLEHDDRERERELLLGLVGRREGADPTAAAAELVSDGFLAAAPAYGVLVVQAFHGRGGEAPDVVRVRLAAAVQHVRRTVAPRHLLVLVTGEQIVGVLACGEPGELDRRGRAVVVAAERNLGDSPGWSPLVAAGAVRDSAADLPAAHAEAQRAVRVARALDDTERFVAWSSLGAYRTLARLLGNAPVPPPPAPVARLLASGDAAVLVPTLECYLDLGGD